MPGTGPFGDAALALHAHRLAVIPVGGEDGKVPLVKWAGWKKPAGRPFLLKLVKQHAEKNIGILCGLSKITVVDIDDRDLLPAMLVRFGSTPLIIETPRGGYHLYYRAAGEHSASLHETENLAVDIKATGGFVVAPPSVRPSGPHAGKPYRFSTGTWDDLQNLPPMKAGSLTGTAGPGAKTRSTGPLTAAAGNRNNFLFRSLLGHARGCDTINDLYDVARELNELFSSPLGEAEVERIVESVWNNYELTGKNWSGQEARAVHTASELQIFKNNADALLLHSILQTNHGGREEAFAVALQPMKTANVIPGWGLNKYRQTRNWLTEKGFLWTVHEGGKKTNDPFLFRFAKPVIVKGSVSVPNIIKHPPSLSALPATHFGERRKNRTPVIGQLDLVELAGGEPRAPHNDPVAFGRQARAARQAHGLTQAQAAKRVGISRSALANVENATYAAGSDLQRRLTAAFGMEAA